MTNKNHIMYSAGIIYAGKKLDKELKELGEVLSISSESSTEEEFMAAIEQRREINKIYQRYGEAIRGCQLAEMDVTVTKMKKNT